MEDLDNVLQGETVEEPETVESKEEPTGEAEAAPPADDTQPEKQIAAFKAQALDERRKRQELERRLKEFEAKQAEIPEEDYFDNPKKVIQTETKALKKDLDDRIYGITEELTRDIYPDYDEIKDYFLENLSESNPEIVHAAMSQPNPHRYIYQQTKKLKKLNEIGDIDKYEQKLREKIKAELQAETRKAPPASLANERAAGKVEHSNNAESLEEIFGR